LDISFLLGQWISYELSSDGKRFTLHHQNYDALFDSIVCINLCPASHAEQQDDDKEIDSATSCSVVEAIVSPLPANPKRLGNTYEVGPPSLKVRWTAYNDKPEAFHAFFIDADYFSVTLVCRSVSINPTYSNSE